MNRKFGVKVCSRCKVEKPHEDFRRNSSAHDGLQAYCKTCQREKFLEWHQAHPGQAAAKSAEYRKKNPEKSRAATAKWTKNHPEAIKDHILRKRYNLTLEQWQEMFDAQQGKCLVCGIHQDSCSKELAVDHDHKTGKVRGLLCCRCNRAVGLMEDDPGLLRKAADHLEKFITLE
jgi:hypothetical protein